jgi:hypothetical protein
MIDWIFKRSKYMKNLNSDLDKRLDKLEQKLEHRIDTVLYIALDKIHAESLKKSQSQSQSHTSLKQSQNSNFETKMIQKLRKSKKDIVRTEMIKLIGFYSTNEIFEELVNKKGLCSKATFYRHLDSLKKSQKVSNDPARMKP